MLYRNRKIAAFFNTLCLHLWLVRADSEWLSRVFHPQNMWFSSDWPSAGSAQRPTPRLWGAAVVEIARNLGYIKLDKKQPQKWKFALHLQTATFPHTQATTARKIQGRSWWDVWRRRVRQTAVVGIQKRLSRCFSWTRSCELAAQISPKIAQMSLGSRAGV